jgi:hypothetical protein
MPTASARRDAPPPRHSEALRALLGHVLDEVEVWWRSNPAPIAHAIGASAQIFCAFEQVSSVFRDIVGRFGRRRGLGRRFRGRRHRNSRGGAGTAARGQAVGRGIARALLGGLHRD